MLILMCVYICVCVRRYKTYDSTCLRKEVLRLLTKFLIVNSLSSWFQSILFFCHLYLFFFCTECIDSRKRVSEV